jgi:uncharacterized phage-associated protein
MPTLRFDAEKSLEAILFIAERLKSKDSHKIFKVLYFADREHLAKYGRSITGDTYIRMGYGPVPSNIYNRLSAEQSLSYPYSSLYGEERRYSQMLAVKNKSFVVPLRKPDTYLLSQSDVEELSESVDKYGNLSFDKLTSLSHGKAWRSAKPNKPIPFEDILREAGESEEYIAYLSEMADAENALC